MTTQVRVWALSIAFLSSVGTVSYADEASKEASAEEREGAGEKADGEAGTEAADAEKGSEPAGAGVKAGTTTDSASKGAPSQPVPLAKPAPVAAPYPVIRHEQVSKPKPNTQATKENVAQPPTEPELEFDGVLGSHQDFVQLALGIAPRFFTSDSYDPYDRDNVMVQAAFRVSKTAYSWGPVSVAAVVSGDYGTSSELARGFDTSLSALRFNLGPEVRYHLLPWLYAYGRLDFGAQMAAVTLVDVGTDYQTSAWGFAFGGSVGAAVQVAGTSSGRRRLPRLWFFAEGGGNYVTEMELALTPAEGSSAPQRAQAFTLPPLSLGGAQLLFGVAVSL